MTNTSMATHVTRLLDDVDNGIDNIDRETSQAINYGTVNENESTDLKLSDLDTTWQTEAKILARSSPPLIGTYTLQYTFNFVTIYVAGRLGTDELAAASLANMTANVTGLFIYEGLTTSLDTLTSQAFGNNKKHLVGLHVQRMTVLVTIVTIPIAAIWWSSPWILRLLVPEKEIIVLAGAYLRVYILGALGNGIFECGKRFTQAQGNFRASLVVLLACAPLNVLLNYIIVFRLNLGFEGAALAATITNILQPIFLALYIYFIAPNTLQCWPGIHYKKIFQNWGHMIRLSIPGIAMTFPEWLAFDIFTFSTSIMGKEYLAAQSILNLAAVVMYHVPFPMSIAASTRFGNLIGKGALNAAQIAFKTYYGIFCIVAIFDLVLLTSLRHVIPAVFSDDGRVRELAASVFPILAVMQVFDAFSAISNGLLRGLGRQKIGAYANLVSFYLIAVPISLTLGFGPPHLMIIGIWIGPPIGLAFCFSVSLLYMRYADWENAVAEARGREE